MLTWKQKGEVGGRGRTYKKGGTSRVNEVGLWKNMVVIQVWK